MPTTQDQRDDWTKETLDRVRRFETRFTRFLSKQKFDTKTDEPVYREGTLYIPSLDVSLKDILAIMPGDETKDIEVIHKDNHVCWISRE
jgi:hypothetical protein